MPKYLGTRETEIIMNQLTFDSVTQSLFKDGRKPGAYTPLVVLKISREHI